ncbi:tolloid-like protein 1 [Clonorchis sinensis]|uniref:Tolloid-like protein 1 n=1 Tax=Clonorchis sinensis TaxID=79923 RepID=G7Y6H6_CLOSI|nr:tolloid-like protein 1 [Clonorchis sinensis]
MNKFIRSDVVLQLGLSGARGVAITPTPRNELPFPMQVPILLVQFSKPLPEFGQNSRSLRIIVVGKARSQEGIIPERVHGSQAHGPYCGLDRPQPIAFHGEVYIEFTSDGNVVETGFQATYQPEIIDCYYTIERPHGIINSPNYPENYPSNANCKWTILKPEVQSILKFHDFHVEWQEDCAKDFVDIYFGTGPTTTKHGPFCNSNPPPSISFTDNVVITFQSDADIEDRGFNASYGPVIVKLAQCLSTHQVYLPLDYSFVEDPL